MTAAEAMWLAPALDLDVDRLPICLACLSVVSTAIDGGEERRIREAVAEMTPDLWAEGLEQPTYTALAAARDRGVEGAGDALADLAASGHRSRLVKAIVRVLAGQLAERACGDPFKMGWKPWPPDEPAVRAPVP